MTKTPAQLRAHYEQHVEEIEREANAILEKDAKRESTLERARRKYRELKDGVITFVQGTGYSRLI